MNYKHGFPISEILCRNIDDILKRVVEDNKAGMILIDGGLGEGKSTLGVQCVKYVNHKLLKQKMNFKSQYAFGGLAFQEKLQICHAQGYNIVIYDESGDFSKRGALTDFNKRLVRVFETFRAYKILVIIILPSVSMMDESIFTLKALRLTINCHGRTNRSGNFRAYSLYRTMFIKDYMKKNIIKEYAYIKTQPNFRGHFLDLDKEEKEELERISIEGKLGILSENVINASGKLTLKSIAYKLKMSQAWVKKKVSAMGVKPSQIYKKKKYYDAEELIPNLEQQIKYKRG